MHAALGVEHQVEQHGDRGRHLCLTRDPAADGAIVDVDDHRETDLADADLMQGRLELFCGHAILRSRRSTVADCHSTPVLDGMPRALRCAAIAREDRCRTGSTISRRVCAYSAAAALWRALVAGVAPRTVPRAFAAARAAL